MNEMILWWLARTPGWGSVKLRQLLEAMGDGIRIRETLQICKSPEDYIQWVETCWQMTDRAIQGERLQIKPKDIRQLWIHQKQWEECRQEYWEWKEKGMDFVPLQDSRYPQRLREIFDPPFALYVRGQLPREDRRSAAIIGARACSGYGAKQGRKIARELAGQGVQIISGLAYGVDSEGHWGALESGVCGATYGVLGCGVDLCYPPEHQVLAERILENGGGLLSEFPPGMPPMAGHFPMRNRIISGLSDCILVMEARKRSGSLITVDQALEQGREVFALPGRVGDSLSEGCLQLIRHGANILMESDDVIQYLFPQKRKSQETESSNLEESNQKAADHCMMEDRNQVYACLDSMGKTVEEIMAMTGLPLDQVRTQLLELLLEGQITETIKGYYSREL